MMNSFEPSELGEQSGSSLPQLEIIEMNKESRAFVAGHRGLVGSAVYRRLMAEQYRAILTRTRAELDLTNEEQVRRFFETERPEYVFVCAARVGGIMANATYPAEFIQQNLAIALNIIHQSWRTGVKRLLFLGSNCIYPRECPQPIKEEYILSGPLEWTNRPYAVAKISGIEMCWAYNRQYGTSYLSLMPVNLYGPGDNFNLQTSHVLPAIVRKIHEAKMTSSPTVTLWGTGTPRREFMHSDDVADAAVFLMGLPQETIRPIFAEEGVPPVLNVGCGSDMTIKETADLAMDVIGYAGRIEWDQSKPDGTMRKLLDNRRIRALGWMPRVPLRTGIERFYQDFLDACSAGAAARL